VSPVNAFTDCFSIRLKRILYATNFTQTSAAALPYAAAFARRFGAEICATHIVSAAEYGVIEPGAPDVALQEMNQAAQTQIERLLAASSFRHIPFRIVLDRGDVLERISAVVDREQIDLIVTASGGRHGFKKLFAPAVDESIARMAACPVLLVGPEVGIEPQAEAHIRCILHPSELQTYSGPALEYAYALAQAYGASLHILHIAEDAWQEPLSTRMAPEAFIRMRLLEIALPAGAAGVEIHFYVEFGPPEELILEAAEKHEAQLIVMGAPATAHPGLSSRLPGPLVYNIASHAFCPVLAVRSSATKKRPSSQREQNRCA
jgi:nucleotide-binding universal stress UspA family protein